MSEPLSDTTIEPVYVPEQADPADAVPTIEWVPSPVEIGDVLHGWEFAQSVTASIGGSPVVLARCPWCRRTGTASLRADPTLPAIAWATNELVRRHFCYAMPAVVLDWR